MAVLRPGSEFDGLSSENSSALIGSIRAGEYNLFLGAGASLDAINNRGEFLPSGTALKEDLCKIIDARPSSSLQRIFSGLSLDQIDQHVTKRFESCTPGPSAEKLPSFIWRRIFTINIDNVLEAAYRRPGNLQTAIPYHFKDRYQEQRTLEEVAIVHLHGDATLPSSGYVFARSEYARLMSDANAWMSVLADIMPAEPFVIAGTALDEIDLEYYLARRSATSTREDRGPSFFVEPFPDAQTERECERYDLTLYNGTMKEFLDDLDALVPNRLPPTALVPSETKDLFPRGASESAILGFSNDFERVPSRVAPTGTAFRFSFGNPPEWNDLASNWDVGRALTSRVRPVLEAMASGALPEKLLVISDGTGMGKTTVARRLAFDLAAKGAVVLNCSALSRIDPRTTSSAIDLIDAPLTILVDNFAEQAPAIAALVNTMEKKDVVFLCAERSYRKRHIVRALGDVRYRLVDGLGLSQPEATQLVESYIKRGMTASKDALKNAKRFAANLEGEPVAVACCHILNDMRPLDNIVKSTYEAASQAERDRYLIAALAHYCFSGGVRFEVLAAAVGREGWNEQFNTASPLPLDYFDSARNFIIPLNATLGERTLARAPAADVANAFERLAIGISARVNRETIRRRAPEARLAGRLFDYEDVLKRFLESGAGNFYAKVQPAWQWNSRYWEQVALFHLARYRNTKDQTYLQQAVLHARHAVAIEAHAFGFTTLGKILLAQIGTPGISNASAYGDAFLALNRAIDAETLRGRASVHAYVTLFRGTLSYLDANGSLSDDQLTTLRTLIDSAAKYFPRDKELREIAQQLEERV